MEKITRLALKMDRVGLLHHAARRRQLHKIGLWRGQMPILEYVSLHEGCTQASLAASLGLSAATVAVSTKRLSRAGLLEKAADEENLRCNKLYLTPAGREKLSAAQKIAHSHNEALFGTLSEAEQQTLEELFDRLLVPFGDSLDVAHPLDNYILHNKLESTETKESET